MTFKNYSFAVGTVISESTSVNGETYSINILKYSRVQYGGSLFRVVSEIVTRKCVR